MGRNREARERPGTISPRAVIWSALLGVVTAAAFATPAYAQPSLPGTVPDPGSRPAPSGALRLPGQTTPPTAPTAPLPAPVDGPLAAQVAALQYEVATLGGQLLTLEEAHNAAVSELTLADHELRLAREELTAAQAAADAAVAGTLKDAAALPLGEFGSDLHGLGALGRLKRGAPSEGDMTGPVRELHRARAAEQTAYQAYVAAEAQAKAADGQFAAAQSRLKERETALVELRRENEAQFIEIERAQEEADQQLGDLIGTGGVAGMAAHPRALAAVRYALAQRGDPYLWGAEGPDRFDCSGLMWAAYRSKGANYYQLPRVAKDQYYATRDRTVDRTALLPGDMIFFNSGNHWSTVHHVGMYIGNGKMVHAPTSGDVVKVSTVRWTSFYRATRIFDAVKAPTTPEPTTPPSTPTPTPPPTPNPPPTPTGPTPTPATEPTPTTGPSGEPPSGAPASPSQSATTPSATPSGESPSGVSPSGESPSATG